MPPTWEAYLRLLVGVGSSCSCYIPERTLAGVCNIAQTYAIPQPFSG